MKYSILQPKKVIIQGITGKNGQFHTERMLRAETNIIAGVSPSKIGSKIHGVPVYGKISDIPESSTIDASVIFVPAPAARGAIWEAIEAEIPLIICITEHIPLHDMLAIRKRLRSSKSRLIGPNTPGLLLPGKQLLGIIPSDLSSPGGTAIISRSGTLTYEAMDLLSRRGVGQSYVIGIGGDSMRDLNFAEIALALNDDPAVTNIVMIGEIGGSDELNIIKYIKNGINKPIFAYIAGHLAPTGVQMGHAGAILGEEAESASYKTAKLAEAGVQTADSLELLIDKVAN